MAPGGGSVLDMCRHLPQSGTVAFLPADAHALSAAFFFLANRFRSLKETAPIAGIISAISSSILAAAACLSPCGAWSPAAALLVLLGGLPPLAGGRAVWWAAVVIVHQPQNEGRSKSRSKVDGREQ
eukprot:CAMPEP_0206307528 /NCGR_PEP_ID=MMETSP0106_2-20121207/11380_1 /ASSEMBLY_ACC=CAM_ASM_000206 /TAXON_ID=81532 /ORGANISM="Acanthoeca-like sp., Strain 10tr" /LENGTH=125 /DNA_ID=CAMNT_0053738519 /DNA_START=77 /DNA_END=454 /DNA_ORIENTATION=-